MTMSSFPAIPISSTPSPPPWGTTSTLTTGQPLERIRALAGDAAGWQASQLGLLHFATSTDADQAYVHNRLPRYCEETAGAVALLGAAVATLDIDVEALRTSAGRNWSTASALAD